MPRSRKVVFSAFEADAVILDDERHGAVTRFEQHVDAARVRVLGDVRQRFLGDAVESDLGLARHRVRLERVALVLDLDAVVFRPLVDVAGKRDGETQVIEDGGAQLPGEERDFGVDALDERQ